ncbi:hypothetical protein BJV82DRAFT_123003 [Fennellomyces sp. T-0311]|nr:hypothetical protein BJV82DRAFT_123003 [Fennellomyces sp. T-0311]
MSLHVNFSTHGQDLKNAYTAVISDSDPTDWLIYSYDKGTNDLRVQGTGDGGLEELNDEFSDGKIQFAFARVIDPNTELPKFVFIAWCGSGVPETRKGFFNSHLIEVSNFFKSFHVQINARDEADVEPELIMKRVSESSGAKYSVHKEQRRAQPAVTPVGSVYKKTEVPDIAAMQRASMKKEGPPAPVVNIATMGTNYKPVQTAPKPLASRWNAATQQQDSGAAAVRAERERAEREVREREEQKAREQLERNRDAEEQERQQLAQEEEARSRAAEESARREREAAAQRQREEAERRQEEERLRYEQQQADAAREAEEAERLRAEQQRAEQQRAEQQRIEQQRLEQQRLEQERQQREEEEARRLEQERLQQEAEAAEAARQREQEAALQNQLDETADRAVHSATHAAGAAVDKAQGAQGTSAVVLFTYSAGEANEMTLVEGEVIVQIDQVDEGWWFGVSEDGKKQGLFPANYVQLLEEEQQPAAQQPTAAAATPAPAAARSPSPVKQDQGNSAVALYDYVAGEDNEISFKENQVITHIEFVSEDWWQGVGPDGRTVGLFPGKYFLFSFNETIAKQNHSQLRRASTLKRHHPIFSCKSILSL